MAIELNATIAEFLADESAAIATRKDQTEKDVRAKEFLRLFRTMSTKVHADAERTRQRAEDSKVAQAKKDRQHRINELLGQVAQLRQKLISSGYDKAIQAELSILQSQLFWLMLSF